MTWPVILSFTLRQAFATVDLVYARYLDDKESALAAIALWIPFQEIYIAVWAGLSAGFTAALAHAFGKRDASLARSLKRAALRIQAVVASGLLACAVAAALTMSSWGLPDDLTHAFRLYGTTLMIGLPLTGFWSIWPDSIVKAHYDMRATMLAGVWATVTNISLNTLFVFVFGWGLFGIAFATVCSRIVALLYALNRARIHERRRAQEAGWHEPAATPSAPSPTRSILVLGIPATITFALAATESSLINRLLLGQPDATQAVASYGVMNVLLKLSLMPASATSIAVVPFIARLAAAGQIEAVRRDLLRAVVLAAGFGLLFTLPAGVFFPDTIGRFFLGENQQAALDSELARQLLHLLPFGALAVTPFLVTRPAFESVQRPRLGIAVAVLRYAMLAWPLILLGTAAAPWLGVAAPLCMAGGSIVAAGIASVTTVFLVMRELRRVAERVPSDP